MSTRRVLAIASAVALMLELPFASLAQQAPAQRSPAAAAAQAPQAIRATTELVLVNVVARDKKGNLVRDLKREDFTVLEDGQKQQVSSFDFENIDEMALVGQTTPTTTGTAAEAGPANASGPSAAVVDARDRRLILLFFDFSAMDTDQIDRAVDSAKKYVDSRMQP